MQHVEDHLASIGIVVEEDIDQEIESDSWVQETAQEGVATLSLCHMA